MTRFLLSMLISFCVALPATAQESKQIWFGVLDAGAMKLRIQMEFEKDGEDGFKGHMLSLDQNNAKVPCSSVDISDSEIKFELKMIGAKYSGKLDDSKQKVSGIFQQGGANIEFAMEKVDKTPTRKHTQTWTGIMKAGPQEFDFQFRVYEDGDEVTVFLDSFSENLEGIGCNMERDGDQVTITVNIATNPATYVGTLDREKKTVVGNWKQKGGEFPLTLTNVPISETRELALKRPQTPKPPFDYDSEDISFENAKANVTLAGTLTSPKGDGPFPTVIMISGSGPQDRDETLFNHKPFLIIADHLAKEGFAVYRYDDRGSHKSTGDFQAATTKDFGDDVMAIVDGLKKHPKVDGAKIILCGHSEGGLIGPMVASQKPEIAGVIMLAGPGVDGRAISVNQSRLMSEAGGVPEYMIEMNQVLLKGLYERQEQGGTLDREFLDSLGAKMKACLPESMQEGFEVDPIIKQTMLTIHRPWFEFFGKYDPAPALEKTKCPVLAIVGEKDTQVDPKLNNPAIEKALTKGGNKDFKIETLPNLNHLFQNCRTGAVSEYNRIEESFAPIALDRMTSWLNKRFK